MVIGGTAMLLGFDARSSTKDVDYAALPSTDNAYLRQLGLRLAEQFDWNDGWLNDAAKGFLYTQSIGPVVYETSGIRVIRPTTAQLLAMKLAAWRDEVDIQDAGLLLDSLQAANAEDVWNQCKGFLIPGSELKARYALDDLWQHRG